MTFGTLAWLLRASGWSLVLLGMLHAAFWKVFEWGDDSARLSPINRRVFIVHASLYEFLGSHDAPRSIVCKARKSGSPFIHPGISPGDGTT